MDSSSLLTSLMTSFGVFVGLMLLHARLSRKPGNLVVYHPNRLRKGLDPFGDNRSAFAWIKDASSTSEAEMISMSGVDTAVYFVFLSTGSLLDYSSYCQSVLEY